MTIKVLFDSHSTCIQNFGGQEVQMLQTKNKLEELGVEVKFFDKFSDKLTEFDIYHLFGSNSIEHLNIVKYVKKIGLPFVLSPVYWNPSEMALKTSNSYIKGIFNGFHHFIIKKVGNEILNPTGYYFSNADIILPNSNLEALHLKKCFKFNIEKISVVYNGVEERFLNSNGSLFTEKFNFKDFVLFVGRIEKKKNVLSLIKAMNELPYDLVLIGDYTADNQYYNVCLEFAGENIHFLGNIEHNSELLQSAYGAAKVFALPSWMETPGISALEAGLAGCRIVITDRGSTKEYFGDMATYCDPDNIISIRSAINEMMNQGDTGNKLRLSNHLIKNFSWSSIAKNTLSVYENLLSQ
jgi:glycosyltransferase involved in cell wall biosynthesis